jgi:methyl-accepting chemotaxis protein
MRRFFSIRGRLLAFLLISLVALIGVACVGGALAWWNHRSDARIATESISCLRSSHEMLVQLTTAQAALQAVLRSQDADEIEAGVKKFQTANDLALRHIEQIGGDSKLHIVAVKEAEEKILKQILLGNNAAALELYINLLDPAVERVIADLGAYTARVEQDAKEAISQREKAMRRILVYAVSLLAVVMGLLAWAGWGLQRSINLPLTRSTKRLSEVSAALEAFSNQVSNSSCTVAEGASGQAASLEETSASIEEIVSMTKRNAENAGRAKTLATHTRQAADVGASDMQIMVTAMSDISASSGNISKIVKTIDEIAFQTNLLALNAAVEAARAGEAGLGFAVVADEVRSLAQRSALAARETAEKIEDSVNKSIHGAQISEKVAASLKAIVERVREVDELLADIASASSEQHDGLAQLRSAVVQIDSITQSNAASAEQGASSAAEMKGEVVVLRDTLQEIRTLIGLELSAVASGSSRLPPSEALGAHRQAAAFSEDSTH